MNVSRPRLSEHFPHVDFPLTIEPRYNIAPTQDVLVVRHAGGAARAELVRWGIELPSGDAGRGGGLINVRSETALGSGFFRRLLENDRVVLPASHFYEWTARDGGRGRRPLMIAPREGVMAFAGLLGRWTNERTGETALAAAILTCPPNELLRPVHHRMPVVLDATGWRVWLDPRSTVEDLARLMAPCPEPWLEVRPVSPLVNDTRHDGPELLEPPPPEAVQQLSLLDGG